MLLQRFYDSHLAQASYLVGCAATGEAIVVDPNRDIEQYLRAAAAEGVRVTHVTETHIHADFVSGSRELARRADAQLILSGAGGPDWQYAFARDAGARLVGEGDVIMVGNVALRVLHVPGHTPEHLAFLVTDTPASEQPMGALTGDFIFVGDVGRPDLLERAAGQAGTMERSARALFHSLQRVKQLPDHLQLWPGHGAGSACGKALGAVPSSTLGYEKLTNWALREEDEAAFVRSVLAGQPEPPAYFATMKRMNREGPRILGGFARPERLSAARLEALLGEGAVVVDTRAAAAFAAGHIPGTINIPLNRSFSTWAGSLLPYDHDLALIVEAACAGCADDAVRELAMIGLDRVTGAADSTVLDAWAARGHELATTPQITAAELAAQMQSGGVDVVDVRSSAEWDAGRLPGVENVPLGRLPALADELGRERPVVVHCQSGARSAIAASVLRAHGVRRVANLAGGYAAWRDAGLPVEPAHDASEPASVA